MKAFLKILIPILIIVILAFVAYIIFVKSNSISAPESIAYDAVGKRFLVSNVQGQSITAMSPEGKYSSFLNKGFKSPRGLAIREGNLYVADGAAIQVVELKTAKIALTIPVQGASLLNDIAFDKAGLLYATDTSGNCAYVINTTSKTAEKVISPLLKSPNGIVYDMPRNQMFIVCFNKRSPILSLSTEDRIVRVFMDSIYSDLDGIAIDDLGRIYISSWTQKMIFEIPQEQNRYIVKFKGIQDAADMLYFKPTNELIVPLHSQNKIIRLSLD